VTFCEDDNLPFSAMIYLFFELPTVLYRNVRAHEELQQAAGEGVRLAEAWRQIIRPHFHPQVETLPF
jgi:hypothetical protein